MSYSHTLYIGWYAELTPTKERVVIGTKKDRECSADSKHSKKMGKGSFCSICGSPIISVEKPTTKEISLACHFFNETDETELLFQTNGRATLQDINALGKSYPIFPEFMPNGTGENRVERIMAPGYITVEEINHCDGLTIDLVPTEKPSEEWAIQLIKIFGCSDLTIKYGMIKEIF